MFSEKYSLFFIDKYHEANFVKLLKSFPQAEKYNDYRCAIYIVALPEVYQKIRGNIGKYPFVWVNAIEEVETIEHNKENGEDYFYYDIKVLRKKEDGTPDYSDAFYALSHSYQSLIKLGEELYGSVHKGFEIMDAIANFDENSYKVFMQALKIRRSKNGVSGLKIEIA